MVLIVIIIGGGLYFWLTKTPINILGNKNANTAVTTNTNTAVVSNVNSTLQVTNSPVEVKGTNAMTGKVTVGGVELTLNSYAKVDTINGVPADKGQTYLLIYFDAVAPASVSAVNQALIADAHLLVGDVTYKLLALKVASTLVNNDRGSLQFMVPTTAQNTKLEIGTGASAQRVTLP